MLLDDLGLFFYFFILVPDGVILVGQLLCIIFDLSLALFVVSAKVVLRRLWLIVGYTPVLEFALLHGNRSAVVSLVFLIRGFVNLELHSSAHFSGQSCLHFSELSYKKSEPFRKESLTFNLRFLPRISLNVLL